MAGLFETEGTAGLNLYWLLYRTPKGPTIYIQAAYSLIAARMSAAIAYAKAISPKSIGSTGAPSGECQKP